MNPHENMSPWVWTCDHSILLAEKQKYSYRWSMVISSFIHLLELVYKSPCFKSRDMSYTIWKQLFGWLLTFKYDLMRNLPLWGTLKNNKRTLKNWPKYAKNLEMTWNFFTKRCWQPWHYFNFLQKVCTENYNFL